MTCKLFLYIACLLLLYDKVTDGRNAHRLRRQTGKSCRTPNNEAGTCINIKQCQPLLNLVITSGNNAQTAAYLRQSQCGVEYSTPKVCCPGQSTVTSRVPPATPTGQPAGQLSNVITSGCGVSERKDTKIVGGKNATLGDWPWIVGLGYRSATRPGPEFKCGATLISNRYVITAAHCVQGIGGFQVSVARLGDLNLNPEVNDGASPIDAPVQEIIVHPRYSTNPMTNDIALIRLQNTVRFTKYIQPICLLSGNQYKGEEYYNRKRPFIIGWGAVEWRGATTTVLQETGINIVDNPTCAQKYSNQRSALIDEKVLCAGEKGKDTCQGDSGGPLIFPHVNADATNTTFYLGGIVSYGIRCDNPDYPGVYTRVAQFIDWINQVTGEHF